MSTPKFKVGDRVRLIIQDEESARLGMEVGDVGTVLENSSTPFVYWDRLNDEWAVYEDEIELISPESELEEPQRNADAVKSSSSEDELAELVRKANEGIKAVYRIIDDFPGQVVDQDGGSLGPLGVHRYTVCHFERGTALKIRPKPAFTPFTVGDDWKVELKGDTLQIGCKDIDVRSAKDILKALCRREQSRASLHGAPLIADLEFSSTRLGIKDSSDNFISWNDADRILKALEEAGV